MGTPNQLGLICSSLSEPCNSPARHLLGYLYGSSWALRCRGGAHVQIRMKLPSEAMLAWLREQAGLQPQLASADSRLRIVAKAILTAGAKSLTHLSTYLQRYQPLLGDLLQDAGPQVRQGPAPPAGTCTAWPGNAILSALNSCSMMAPPLSLPVPVWHGGQGCRGLRVSGCLVLGPGTPSSRHPPSGSDKPPRALSWQRVQQ